MGQWVKFIAGNIASSRNWILTLCFWFICIWGVLGLIGVVTTGIRQSPETSKINNNYVFRPPKPIANFTLTSTEGYTFTKADLLGKWHILSYGFTSCPDICPTTLLTMKSISQRLEQQQLEVAFLFYTIDPGRDNINRLKEYIGFFGEGFGSTLLGLRSDGTAQALAFERDLGIQVTIAEVNETKDNSNGNYSVIHGMAIYLINPSAELQAVLLPDVDPLGKGGYQAEELYRAIGSIIGNSVNAIGNTNNNEPISITTVN